MNVELANTMLWLPVIAEIKLPLVEFSSLLAPVGLVVAGALLLHLALVLTTRRQRSSSPRLGWLGGGLYVLFLLTIAVLAASSFGSILSFGHMSGYALMSHVAVAGAFTLLLLAMAWWLVAPAQAPTSEATTWWLPAWSSWLLVLSSLVAAGTMFLSMLPVLDTQGLLQAAAVHRYAGLLVVIAAVVHVYALLCQRLGWR